VGDGSSPFLLSRGGLRLIQLQPLSRCNLRCRHCYSSSGPHREREISAERLEPFLTDARSLGYGYVGVSGGEPLLWGDLDRFLEFASSLGFATSVITNGTLVDTERAVRLRDRTGLVAVSVEGPPEDHDAIRGTGSFAAMRDGLRCLRSADVRFVLVFTLTLHNADRLTWLYGFAEEVGAYGVEVHPLVSFGEASHEMANSVPDSEEFRAAGRVLALLSALAGEGGATVTLDVARIGTVRECDWAMLADDGGGVGGAPFSDLVPSLVVEPDGCVTPFIYGFPRRWALGSVGRDSLTEAAERWKVRHAAEVSRILRDTVASLERAGEEFVDLFGEALATAHSHSTGQPIDTTSTRPV
jgi:MoaA/NifB/PqqE/SkfB family radical SAM enzyme